MWRSKITAASPRRSRDQITPLTKLRCVVLDVDQPWMILHVRQLSFPANIASLSPRHRVPGLLKLRGRFGGRGRPQPPKPTDDQTDREMSEGELPVWNYEVPQRPRTFGFILGPN